MEKITCICAMRDLFLALNSLETSLLNTHGVSLNEAMVLCSIGEETIPANMIVQRTGMTPSHTSKVISSAEKKGLLNRKLGKVDKRQMYFSLTKKAKECVKGIKEEGIEVPEILIPFFQCYKD